MTAPRDRWNDQSVDLLATRVGDAEDQLVALRLLPERVHGLRGAVEDMREDFNAAAGLEERRVSNLHAKVERVERKLDAATEKLAALIDRRFDVVDQAGEATRGVDWKTVVAVAATVVVPIVVALIALAGAR